MKTLTEAIAGLNQTYNDIDIIEKWCKSEAGRRMSILFFHGVSIFVLMHTFKCPKIKTKDAFQIRNIYKHAFKKAGYAPEGRFKPIPGYSKTLEGRRSAGTLKLPKNASKKELMAMNGLFKRDLNGKFIQASDKQGRKFWNSVTNRPIYKRARLSKKGLKLAEKCHAYELHKMAKWDRRNPVPSRNQLCTTLFPEQVIAAHNAKRNIFLEHVRDELSVRYCGSAHVAPLLRMYSVHRSKGYMGQLVMYEREIEPFVHGYPFSKNRTIHESLVSVAMHNTDSSVVAFKVYDNLGTMRDVIRLAALCLTILTTRTISQC